MCWSAQTVCMTALAYWSRMCRAKKTAGYCKTWHSVLWMTHQSSENEYQRRSWVSPLPPPTQSLSSLYLSSFQVLTTSTIFLSSNFLWVFPTPLHPWRVLWVFPYLSTLKSSLRFSTPLYPEEASAIHSNSIDWSLWTNEKRTTGKHFSSWLTSSMRTCFGSS